MSDKTILVDGQEFYEGTFSPVWRYRRRGKPAFLHPEPEIALSEANAALIDTKYVRLLLDRLDELERSTRPSAGPATEERKDLAAFNALNTASSLVKHVAGWAIAHQVGLAAQGMRFVPLQPSKTKTHPQYLLELSKVDSHEHERVGSKGQEDFDPSFLRKCLVNLLQSNAGAMPSWLAQKVIDALEALEYGEVQPIFKPVRSGGKRDLTAKRLQLRALTMVAYRVKRGLTKEKAVQKVAENLGVSPYTILSWEPRLRNDFGDLEVDRTIAFSENHASWVNDAYEKARPGEEMPDFTVHSAAYDDDALAALGTEYKAALK